MKSRHCFDQDLLSFAVQVGREDVTPVVLPFGRAIDRPEHIFCDGEDWNRGRLYSTAGNRAEHIAWFGSSAPEKSAVAAV
jgi:hypothetical protein